jgi:sugar lactone lactonase YvrE
MVTLNVVSNATPTSVTSGGVVTANGGTISANGVCWSTTNQTPTIADSKTTDTINVNGFTSRIVGLTPSTTYYLRAYATNEGGTGYGSVLKFTTPTTTITTTVSTIAGSVNYGYLDGAGASALFSGPQGLTYNSLDGNIYIMDALNNAMRTMTTTGIVSTWGNPALGYVDGTTIATSLFYAPRSVAFDAQGNAYIADFGNNVIRKVTKATGAVTTIAGNGRTGHIDGTVTSKLDTIEFNSPQGIAVDATGNIYVADRGNNAIRKITPTGAVYTIAGGAGAVQASYTTVLPSVAGYADAAGLQAQFNSPCAVALDGQGNLYVADQNNRAIRVITLSTGMVTTLAGTPVQKTVIGAPVALNFDTKGNLYVADASGRIMEITSTKVLYTLAGSYNNSGYTDGTGTAALFSNPQGVAVDAQGNIYVSDFNNNIIRKIVVKVQ